MKMVSMLYPSPCLPPDTSKARNLCRLTSVTDVFEKDIVISPFLLEHVFLPVPEGNSLENRGSIAVSDIPAQPLPYPSRRLVKNSV